MIQAALNGSRPQNEHPALPCSPEELALDAADCVAAGAGAIHMHPRDAAGNETLDPMTIYAACRQVKATTGVSVGVSTGSWIEPNLEQRLALIRAWYGPDYASVNCSEDGAIDVMYALVSAGIGIEVGIGRAEEVEVFARSLLVFSNSVVRILVEPDSADLVDEVAATVRFDAIHGMLDRLGIMNPRLQHTDGRLAWFAVRDALRRGWDTRIGFEDTLKLARGRVATSNAELIAAAVTLPKGRK